MDITIIQMVWTVRHLSSLSRTETSHHGTETRNRQKTENPTKGPSVDKGSGTAMISVGSKWAYQQQRNSTVMRRPVFLRKHGPGRATFVPFRLPLLSRDPTTLSVSIWKEPHSRYCSEWQKCTIANEKTTPASSWSNCHTVLYTSTMNHSTPSNECPNQK